MSEQDGLKVHLLMSESLLIHVVLSLGLYCMNLFGILTVQITPHLMGSIYSVEKSSCQTTKRPATGPD